MKNTVTILLLTIFLFSPKLVRETHASGSIPILLYHYIGNNPDPKDLARNSLSVAPDKFDAQMDYLAKNGYTPISLDTLYGIFSKQIAAPVKPVVLTFDDGYIDFYLNAFPILKKYNFHAVSFVITGKVGGGYYLNWDQIKQMQSSGLISFEAHTVTHRNLTSLTPAAISEELTESKNTLQKETGYPVNFIAYPSGITNAFVENIASKLGFSGGVGTWFGKAAAAGLNMPRIRIAGQTSLASFAAKL